MFSCVFSSLRKQQLSEGHRLTHPPEAQQSISCYCSDIQALQRKAKTLLSAVQAEKTVVTFVQNHSGMMLKTVKGDRREV